MSAYFFHASIMRNYAVGGDELRQPHNSPPCHKGFGLFSPAQISFFSSLLFHELFIAHYFLTFLAVIVSSCLESFLNFDLTLPQRCPARGWPALWSGSWRPSGSIPSSPWRWPLRPSQGTAKGRKSPTAALVFDAHVKPL